MTQAGLLLLFICMGIAMLFFSRRKARFLWGFILPAALFALVLTLTRSAWIGVVVGAAVVLALYRPKFLVAIPLVIALFFIFSPKYVKTRVLSIFGLKNYWNVQRIEYMKTGWEIIKEFPLFGTGPDTVDLVFQHPKYNLSQEAKNNVHLHNNILQICAERGIPAFLAWAAFMIITFLSLMRLLKNKDPSLTPLTAAALASLLALATAGLFEYNFGDSEIKTLFLYIITIPFVVENILKKHTFNIEGKKDKPRLPLFRTKIVKQDPIKKSKAP
jgi:O-antigen ligase